MSHSRLASLPPPPPPPPLLSSSQSRRNSSRQASVQLAEGPNFVSRMRNFASLSKPQVEIVLSGGRPNAWVHSFSTMDAVRGVVSIVASSDVRFDRVDIDLVGTSKTRVDKMTTAAVNGLTEAFHPFLTLSQPDLDNHYPTDRVFRKDVQYELPFEFRIPSQLLINSCRHDARSPKLKDAHLQLPPSLGDPELSGAGGVLLSDMSPDMARIGYAIKARIHRNRDRDGKEMLVVERSKKIRVVPATEEQPPVDIDGQDEEICLRKEKGIKKGLFTGKIGRLVVEATQPRSLRLAPPSVEDAAPPSTTLYLKLRFDPTHARAQPPPLGSLSTKLKVATFYASNPQKEFPSKGRIVYDSMLAVHVEAPSLSQRNVSSVQWVYHDGTTAAVDRRDSAFTLTDSYTIPQASEAYSPGKPFYTARIPFPIDLPANRCFVPTFHSCLVSRIYIIDATLNIPNSGSGAGVGKSITLKVPVQVSSSSAAGQRSNSAVEAADLEQAQTDDFFIPRSVAPPPAEYLHRNSVLGGNSASPPPFAEEDAARPAGADAGAVPNAPPEYSYFAPANPSGFVPCFG